ncbi:MAG: response regulator, partial [Silvanigrellaceae bacterium]|nr:response regulator [Silvanigrellaceae bacterium]
MELLNLIHIDDDLLELRRIKRIFDEQAQQEKAGWFRLFSFCHESDLLAALKTKETFHIFLLDIHLTESSEKSGIYLIEKIRRSHPQAVIIMFSHLDDPQSVLESLQWGADDFVSKNTEREQLALRIMNSFERTMLKRGEGKYALLENTMASENPDKGLPVSFAGTTMRKLAFRVPHI